MLTWKKFLDGSYQLLDAAKDGDGGGGGGGSKDSKDGDDSKDSKDGAEGSSDDSSDADGGNQLDVEKLPDAAKKLIKDLRSENAKQRMKAKEALGASDKLKKALVEAGILEETEANPEEKIKGLTSQLHGAEFKSAVLEAAVEHSVPKGQLKYFQFLLGEAMESLEDGAELSEEQISTIAREAKKQAAGGAGANSSVGSGKGSGSGQPPPGGDKGAVTLDQFVKMSMMEKSDLYGKNPDLYSKLLAEAKGKKVLV